MKHNPAAILIVFTNYGYLKGRNSMFNYEHETKDINDRYLKHYVFYDYFHDSIIHNINICHDSRYVFLELSCERDWPGNEREKYMFDTKYMYKLTFENCKHIEYQRDNVGKTAEYINGRFKDTARLRQIIVSTRKKYYHLRIQLADGFLDLIFSKFAIEKAEGKIELPARIETRWYFDWVLKKFNNDTIEEIRKIAEFGEFPLKPWALEYLWRVRDKTCCNLAIKSLDDEDSWIGAVFILGEIGDSSIMPILLKCIGKFGYESLANRHVNDAVEKIIYRLQAVPAMPS
jgi:hypothetical protein